MSLPKAEFEILSNLSGAFDVGLDTLELVR